MKMKFRSQENMPKWPKSEILKNGICPQSGTLTVDHVLYQQKWRVLLRKLA